MSNIQHTHRIIITIMQNHLFKLVIALTTLVALTNAQGTKNENFPLSETSVTHCDTIIDGSKIEGDCCALNVTAGNGCVVNVEGGRCKVSFAYVTV